MAGTLPDALDWCVDNEIVLSLQEDGSIMPDAPLPEGILELLKASRDIAVEFARGDFFMSAESLEDCISKLKPDHQWVYARFPSHIIRDAMTRLGVERTNDGWRCLA